jgi:hypothetical protein
MHYGVNEREGQYCPVWIDDSLASHPLFNQDGLRVVCATPREGYTFLHDYTARSNQVDYAEITYGMEHSACARAFVGEDYYHNCQCLDNEIYMTPVRASYQLSDGRVLEVVQKVFSNLYCIFPNYETYQHARRLRLAGERDPETGR